MSNTKGERPSAIQNSMVDRIDTARRRLIKQSSIISAGVALGAFSVPSVFAKGSREVIVRGLGGAYQEAMETAIYKPLLQQPVFRLKSYPRPHHKYWPW